MRRLEGACNSLLLCNGIGVLKKLQKSLCLSFVYTDTSMKFAYILIRTCNFTLIWSQTGRARFCLLAKVICKEKKEGQRGLKFEEPVSNTQLNLVNSIHNCCLFQLSQLQLIPIVINTRNFKYYAKIRRFSAAAPCVDFKIRVWSAARGEVCFHTPETCLRFMNDNYRWFEVNAEYIDDGDISEWPSRCSVSSLLLSPASMFVAAEIIAWWKWVCACPN